MLHNIGGESLNGTFIIYYANAQVGFRSYESTNSLNRTVIIFLPTVIKVLVFKQILGQKRGHQENPKHDHDSAAA